MSSCQEILIDALQNIQVTGLIESEAHAEDTALALRKFNLRGSNWNTRKAFSKFERMQAFFPTVSKASYTIGPLGRDPDLVLNPLLDPDFLVLAGNAPVKIDRANWLLGSGAAVQAWPIEIIEVQQYSELFLPAFTGVWPYGIYYQRTQPASTLWPWPIPTDLISGLQLFWGDQFVPVAIEDISLELFWPEGYELAFSLTLSEDLCASFGKEPSAWLTKAAGQARADYSSTNRKPPRLDTSGRVASPVGWRQM